MASYVDKTQDQARTLFSKVGARSVLQTGRVLAFRWWAVLVIMLLVALAMLAPLITVHDPTATSLRDTSLPPYGLSDATLNHPLGTDQVGRDLYSRVVYGGRISLGIAAIAILLSGGIGTALGLLAGYMGGLVEVVIMRLVDMLLALPIFLLAIVVAAAVGPSTGIVVGIITVLLWPYFARQIRGETLSLIRTQYVEASRALGASHLHVMLRHLLPNLLPTIIVFATLQVSLVIVTESSLSFLGVGVPPPTPTWGRMVADGRDVVVTQWWISAIPGVVISVVVLLVSYLGDQMRDRLDPTLRQR